MLRGGFVALNAYAMECIMYTLYVYVYSAHGPKDINEEV